MNHLSSDQDVCYGLWAPPLDLQPYYAYEASDSIISPTPIAIPDVQPTVPLHTSTALHPMPASEVTSQESFPSSYDKGSILSYWQTHLQDTEHPTRVVGSQGRRGVLLSAHGKPIAPTGSEAFNNAVIPEKGTDGRVACTHCTRTYLHVKHLKRHLLRRKSLCSRESGIYANVLIDFDYRPYMCKLCHATFFRSDVLKRHFQKCSTRRGNPMGAYYSEICPPFGERRDWCCGHNDEELIAREERARELERSGQGS
ncbi:hypothetical protein F4778DRAFT_729021 [Xylariomycetidae sp. FL2044]|nr:hypothetical protein F4778DRAFT_729021 [Xylariomycetidae sp. FL2044]